MSMPESHHPVSALGIGALALGMVTPLVANLVSGSLQGGASMLVTVLSLLLMWLCAFSAWWWIARGEHAAVRFRLRTDRRDVLVAILFGIGGMLLVPVLSLLVAQIIGATELVESAERSPVWLIAAGVLTAAVTEEVLYRAAPIELLLRRGAPQWLAALLPLIVFVISHLGSWNLAHIVGVVIPMGILLSLLYLWRRSLTVNIVAHLIIDVPLIVIALAAG